MDVPKQAGYRKFLGSQDQMFIGSKKLVGRRGRLEGVESQTIQALLRPFFQKPASSRGHGSRRGGISVPDKAGGVLGGRI